MRRYLYVNGCSVTHGYGIDAALLDQFVQSDSEEIVRYRYGSLVARHLGLEEVNRAKRGGSNDRILRTSVADLSAREAEIGFCLIGFTNPFRSELRFNERYVRMFFGQEAFGKGLTEGFDYCNRFFFEQDASRNEYLARDYLEHCNSIIRYGYDETYLAERLLTQILLLQGLLRGLRIGWLFVPVLDVRFPRKTLKQFDALIAAVDATRFLRFREAIEDGWCVVKECESRGLDLYKGHPRRDGHELIASQLVAAIDGGNLRSLEARERG